MVSSVFRGFRLQALIDRHGSRPDPKPAIDASTVSVEKPVETVHGEPSIH